MQFRRAWGGGVQIRYKTDLSAEAYVITRGWRDGLRDVAVAASQLATKTRVISVMDREADFFELFDNGAGGWRGRCAGARQA